MEAVWLASAGSSSQKKICWYCRWYRPPKPDKFDCQIKMLRALFESGQGTNLKSLRYFACFNNLKHI
jgi:hypothetical protein